MKTKIINIYGDITEHPCFEGDMSASMLSGELKGDYDEIIVNINSFGGSVSEGLSIYNQLKQHPAKVKTICNGFACSIASIIFLAGDERFMCNSSLLMVHHPWTTVQGNSSDLKKEAEALEKIAEQSINIYCEKTGLDEDAVKELLDNETWIDSNEALDMGFATGIVEEKIEVVAQSVRQSLISMLKREDTKDNKKEDPQEVKERVELKTMSSFLNLFERKGD